MPGGMPPNSPNKGAPSKSTGKTTKHSYTLEPVGPPEPMTTSAQGGKWGLALGAEGVLPGRQIESLLRVCNQFAPTLPSG